MTLFHNGQGGRGEGPERDPRPYHSTRQQRLALIWSVQLPVLLWTLCGYLLASRLFELGLWSSVAAGAGCGWVIFLVEQLVIAVPPGKAIATVRLTMALLMASLGACVFDLVVFEKDIAAELQKDAVVQYQQDKKKSVDAKQSEVNVKKSAWEEALKNANCEANATCGSRKRGTDKVWQQLKLQADLKREDYRKAEGELEQLKKDVETGAQALAKSDEAVDRAGVLQRLEALHHYIAQHPAALASWIALFLLVTMLEASVLVAKFAFGETVEEKIQRAREQLALQRVQRYALAMQSAQSGNLGGLDHGGRLPW